MDSQRSDSLYLIACFRESARRGDWSSAGEFSTRLLQQTPPANRDDLDEYLQCMKEALIVAKASRAHAAASLVRLNAAASFNNRRMGPSALPRNDPPLLAGNDPGILN
jgi:hypothetical protein